MGIVIGLTGSIASGKSTISNMLYQKGIPIVDADVIAREVVEKGQVAYNQIIEVFGQGILQADGTIYRQKLGEQIFLDKEKRKQLNNIMHPIIYQRIKKQRDRYINQGNQLIILDIPLLFEENYMELVDKILVVYVDEKTQLSRLMFRNTLSQKDAQSRILSQISIEEKKHWADAVINNCGTIDESKQQLIEILQNWNIYL